jgi:hypothetical protein
MALFNRRKDQTISDLEDYYANRNNRTGMAWLMAFLSLLVTIGIVGALFFGGRWVYRTLTDDNTTVITTNTPANTTENPATTTEESTTQQTQQGATNTSDQVEPAGVVSDEAVSTSTPNTSSSNNRSGVAGTSSTPSTGDSDELPKTGAGEILFILPIIAAVAGYSYNRSRQLQK